jgi:hypothetical protein
MAFWLITALIGLPLTAAIAAGYHYRRAHYPAPVPIAAWDRDNAANAVASVTRCGPIERRARNRSALLSLLADEAARTLFVYFGQRAHPSDAFVAPCMWQHSGAHWDRPRDQRAAIRHTLRSVARRITRDHNLGTTLSR